MFKLPRDKVFVIAEIGINHNGDVKLARELIEAARAAGCDAVKFQKRTPLMSLPPELWDVERDTPWGVRMTYRAYRERIELSSTDYRYLKEYCDARNMIMFASPWDANALDTLMMLDMPLIKVASATVTNLPLIDKIGEYGRPVIMSTGMSTLQQVEAAVSRLRRVPELGLLVCTSKYPAPVDQLHLSRIYEFKDQFPHAVIGYSGHEVGLWTTLCAVAMGAQIIERHITLDRSMKGSDHAASVEPAGFKLLVREIRQFEKAKGTREIRPLECEAADIARLRGKELPATGATRHA